jgi:Flp pilus assembly protein TadB
MAPTLIAALTSVIVIMITTLGQWLSNRNDRALAHQEVELLKHLQPNSRAAKDLEEVIASRIDVWKFELRPVAVFYRVFAFWAVLAYLFSLVFVAVMLTAPRLVTRAPLTALFFLPVVVCSFYAARNLRRSHDAARGKFWPVSSRSPVPAKTVDGSASPRQAASSGSSQQAVSS